MTLRQRLQLFFLRQRLARTAAEIEHYEEVRRKIAPHIAVLEAHAANLRATIWYAENPRPPHNTTLRGLNSPG